MNVGNHPSKFVVDFQGTKTDEIFYLTDLVNEQFSEFFLMVSTEHLARDCSPCSEQLPYWLVLAE